MPPAFNRISGRRVTALDFAKGMRSLPLRPTPPLRPHQKQHSILYKMF